MLMLGTSKAMSWSSPHDHSNRKMIIGSIHLPIVSSGTRSTDTLDSHASIELNHRIQVKGSQCLLRSKSCQALITVL